MTGAATLPSLVERFFTLRLMRQRNASPHTIASYRDTFRLLFVFAQARLSKPPSRLDLADLDAPFIGAFLDDLEASRSIGIRTRNLRLTAIRAFFRFAALEEPAYSGQIQRVLAIPGKLHDKREVHFLTRSEIDAILAAPDRSTWIGRRDHMLLHLAVQTGLRLREITLSCIGAWAADSERVAVAASGGLDSSIICAALAGQKRPFDCITIATADPSGDESAYVGQLAAALGVRMVRQMFDPAGIDLARPASAGLPRPVRKAFMQELRRAMREGAGELGADVVFDGNGGDNLFCYLHSAAPIVYRFWQEGPGIGMLRSIVDMCRMTESDVPMVLQAVVRRLTRAPAPAWIADDRLLARDLQSAPVPIALTPWNLHKRRAPGKAAHIGLIQRAQNFTHDLTGASGPMQFSPLMSQPLLEFCLSVPSWEWCHGGINRSLAREAFRADLPAATLSRTAKAGPDSFLRVVLRRNRRLIREMLHDGLLVRHGVLDMAAVEQAVTIDEQADDPIINRLLDVVEAEAWARSWNG